MVLHTCHHVCTIVQSAAENLDVGRIGRLRVDLVRLVFDKDDIGLLAALVISASFCRRRTHSCPVYLRSQSRTWVQSDWRRETRFCYRCARR